MASAATICNITAIPENYIKILFRAIELNDIVVVKQMLSQDLSLLHREDDGWTALHKAAAYDRLDVLELLVLEYKVDINQQDSQRGNFALHRAAEEAIRWLYANGAKQKLENYDGATPLHLAAFTGNVTRIRALCAVHNYVNHKTSGGYTPLMYALQNRQAAAVRELLSLGADVKIVAKKDTALHLALERDMFDIFLEFVEMGADVNVKVTGKVLYSGHLLRLAILKQHVPTVQALIDHGIDKDKEGVNLQDFIKTQMVKWCNDEAAMMRLRTIARLLFPAEQAVQLELDPAVVQRRRIPLFEKLRQRKQAETPSGESGKPEPESEPAAGQTEKISDSSANGSPTSSQKRTRQTESNQPDEDENMTSEDSRAHKKAKIESQTGDAVPRETDPSPPNS